MPKPIRRAQLSEDVPSGSTKDTCRLASNGGSLGLSGLADIDGVTPVAGDRILAKDQSTPSQNGIYVADAAAWTRAIDFDDNEDADSGTVVSVSEGGDNAGTSWKLTTVPPITLGSTALTFQITSRAGTDPSSHADSHLPSGDQPLTTAAAVGLDTASTSTEGGAESLARSNHTHAIDSTGGTISTINAGDSESGGSGTGFAKRDHQHPVATGGATTTIQPDDTAAEGTSSNLAREDHQHPIVAAAPTTGIGAGNQEGSSTSWSRADHNHTIREAGGQDLTMGAVSDGQLVERSANTLAGTTSINDTQHGSRGGTTLHAVATTGANGFMSAADKAKLDSLISGEEFPLKDECRVATAVAGTLATSFANGQTIDGVVIATGDRILIKNQAAPVENGIYVVNATGAPTRAGDMDTGDSASSSIIPIDQGDKNKDSVWFCTTDRGSDVVGTNGLLFTLQSQGDPRMAGDGLTLDANNQLNVNPDGTSIEITGDQVAVKEINDTQHGDRGGGTLHADVVAGGADGFMTGSDKSKLDGIEAGATNETFHQELVTTQSIINSDTALTDTLNAAPKSVASVLLFLNGVQQIQGTGEDYTLGGVDNRTITWLASTGTAVNMKVTDKLVAYYVS